MLGRTATSTPTTRIRSVEGGQPRRPRGKYQEIRGRRPCLNPSPPEAAECLTGNFRAFLRRKRSGDDLPPHLRIPDRSGVVHDQPHACRTRRVFGVTHVLGFTRDVTNETGLIEVAELHAALVAAARRGAAFGDLPVDLESRSTLAVLVGGEGQRQHQRAGARKRPRCMARVLAAASSIPSTRAARCRRNRLDEARGRWPTAKW